MQREFHCLLGPLPSVTVAVWNRNSIARYPKVVLLCNAGVPVLSAPKRCGNVLREFQSPLPRAVWQCSPRVPLPTTPRAMWRCFLEVPLPSAPRR